jgi:hypothetical protein
MAKQFFETIIASGGFAGETFDVSSGPANIDVIDVLLSVGNGALQENAPINLHSTGVLGSARTLDLAGIEQNGRVFTISVRNSDITANNLTVSSSTDINGLGATLVISTAADYIFVHETGGSWRSYQQRTSQASDALVFRTSFVGSDWTGGTANQINIVQTGAPGAGEIGPHGLTIASSYVVQVYNDTNDRMVGIGVEIDGVTGIVTLRKTGLAPNFAGRVIVLGT